LPTTSRQTATSSDRLPSWWSPPTCWPGTSSLGPARRCFRLQKASRGRAATRRRSSSSPTRSSMGKALALLSKFNSVGIEAKRFLNHSLDRLQSGFMSVRKPVDLGIVTALDHEFVAVETCMTVKIKGEGGKVVAHEPFGRAPVKF